VRLDRLVAEAGLADSGLLVELVGDATVEVSELTLDSRRVTPGAMFACVPGQIVDGHVFAAAAVSDGAAALLCERRLDLDVAQVVSPSARRSLGPLADTLQGHPSARLTVIGVTGTNGKTTTCSFLKAVCDANGWPTLAIGTLSQSRTTPEAPELQARLAEWSRAGGRAVAMEVSSHALVQHRADSVRFAAGIFTNLSPEHLDYHDTMDAYFEAKALLFEAGRAGVAVVNGDDAWGRRLAARVASQDAPVTLFDQSMAEGLDVSPRGSTFSWRGHPVSLKVGGRFNVWNAIAAGAAAEALGIEPEVVAEGLSSVEEVPGRFQKVEAGQDFTLVIDYAHTPDGLTKVLEAAREICQGRLIVVFGAGGDRDRDKRPLMGEAASRAADLVVVTSDNPRSEDPDAIVAEVASGASGRPNLIVDADRASAITTALANAGSGDVVVIAGKGHERTQEIAGRLIAFDDVEMARQALSRIQASRQERR